MPLEQDFFERKGPFALRDVAAHAGAELAEPASADIMIADARPLSDAGPDDISFCESRGYLDALAATEAGACFLPKAFAAHCPEGTAAVISAMPQRDFAKTLCLLYPNALRTQTATVAATAGGELVHPSAEIAASASIEPGAVIGPEAQIGPGTIVAANAVVGYRVRIGRDCFLGAGCSVVHAHLGDRVILHAGVRVGQDGFGFAMSPEGHFKIPQLGRVLIGDDVEIGANSCVDRGGLHDTVIGAGTKIDNLVQIGHAVTTGRHCIITSQSGLGGSARLGNLVIMGATSGVLDHVKVGDGALIAGAAHAKDDVPAGAKMGGTPAVPFKQYARELAAVRLLAQKKPARGKD